MERYRLINARIELAAQDAVDLEVKLVDLSFNSVRLITALSLHEEQDVLVRILTSFSKTLSLKGYVIRVEDKAARDGQSVVAIKFHPFSTYDRFNTLDDRKKLKSIIEKAKTI